MAQSKRQDLQGIRGLAIISVLGFHFYPMLFPNGYLGVDQFFVLSGFLMCMLLTKTDQMAPISAIVLFYSKRFKRILPLYLFVILLTLIALYTVFPETAVLQNEMSATKALFFVSNRQHTQDEDYFEKLAVAIDLFAHTWSLSVEIQFYFIVPFIFLSGNLFSGNMKYAFYGFLGVISLSFYYLSPRSVAFNSVFARIWQFLIGMVIYLTHCTALRLPDLPYTLLRTKNDSEIRKIVEEDISDESDDEGEQDESKGNESLFGPSSKYFFLLPMAYIVSYPIPLFANVLRPLFAVFTGILMLLSIDDAYLSNRFLTYIGDISYSLYLIHWPVYAYAKLTYPGNQYVVSSSLIASVLLSILIHETFEKWYLKLKNTSVAVIIILLFAANVVLVNKDAVQERIEKKPVVFVTTNQSRRYERLDGVTPNMTFDDAEVANLQWNRLDIFDPAIRKSKCTNTNSAHANWCAFDVNGTEFRFALLGNSYTLNHYELFLQECRHRAKSVNMAAERSCEPLATATDPGCDDCVKKTIEFTELIEAVKPDYAFIFTRYFAVANPFENNITDLEKDKTYLEMRSQLKKFLPNIKKKLFILDSFPRVNTKKIAYIAKNVKEGKSFEYISKYLLASDDYKRGRTRHAALVKECGGKCELIDYMPLFWNSTTQMTQYFDARGFSYFTSPHHLTARALELVRPIYTKICAELK